MSELILVRHGQASFGEDSYDRLSENGHRQASILAGYWQSLGEQFDAIYSGTLRRQQETAAVLLPLVAEQPQAPVIHPGLDEYDGSPLISIYLRDHAAAEGFDIAPEQPITDRRQFQLVFEAATTKWLNDELEPRTGDSVFESWPAFTARVHRALDEIMQQHSSRSRVLISTSGGVIAVALQKVLALPGPQTIATNWMVNNSSFTRIRYGAGRLSLSQFNAMPHLENRQYRDLITYR